MIDAVAGAIVLAAGLVVAAASALRPPRSERVERAGASALLGAGVQHAAYRFLQPLGRGLARAGVSANVVTLASLPFGGAAAWAVATGHYGLAAVLAGISYACDALDGIVARSSGTASAVGEVLDAACDRICEASMLGGVAFAWRGSPLLLALALAAGLGAEQVTLASAKAEAFPAVSERVPRGMMRRAERAAYFVGAAALGGVLLDTLPPGAAPTGARIPLVVSMLLIAVVGNASALQRLGALARALRAHHPVTRAGD
ncbi:MAG TPA: CDP-alcohol phosphatidyltransferase family protein [Polyangiaceae bacterium]|jgi:phosphatidylglycerophosphate synthase